MLALGTLVVIDSCSPDVGPPPVTTMLTYKSRSGMLKNQTKDTNLYQVDLSCGCAFTLVSLDADTTHILYDLRDLPDTLQVHNIRATIKPGALPPSGTYISYVAIMAHPQPSETFRDTLRDTLIVP